MVELPEGRNSSLPIELSITYVSYVPVPTPGQYGVDVFELVADGSVRHVPSTPFEASPFLAPDADVVLAQRLATGDAVLLVQNPRGGLDLRRIPKVWLNSFMGIHSSTTSDK